MQHELLSFCICALILVLNKKLTKFNLQLEEFIMIGVHIFHKNEGENTWRDGMVLLNSFSPSSSPGI